MITPFPSTSGTKDGATSSLPSTFETCGGAVAPSPSTSGTNDCAASKVTNGMYYWDHASVRRPSVLHTNVGHSKLGYRTFLKIISSDISAFEQGHCHVCW